MATEWQRTLAVPIESLPGALPHVKIPEDVDADAAAQSCIEKLNSPGAEHFHSDGFWRDLLAFTNTFRTFHQPEHIIAAWKELSSVRQPSDFKLKAGSAHATQIGPVGWIDARFTFKIGGDMPGQGSGFIFIVPDEQGGWKIWLLSTILEEMDALGNPDVLEKAKAPLSNGAMTSGTQEETTDCVLVGAGQNGLAALGRLKALGVKAVALEKYATIGGNWTGRYDTVKLHTGKFYADMPFGQTFRGEEYPYFLEGKDLARGFQRYVDDYGLDVRLSTAVESAKWDESSKTWTVYANQKGSQWSIKARHIVFAVGPGGQVPKMPKYPNQEAFKGTAMHSVDYKGPAEWKGRKGVVVGTGNTAHDVAEDMLEAELSSVTMIQRKPTAIIPWHFFERHHARLYNEKSNQCESDRVEFSLPMSFYQAVTLAVFKGWAAAEPEHFDALERAGFRTERVPNLYKILRERLGGHYLDMGCSQKIIDGLIKIKGGEIESYTPTGLRFADGSTLDVDLIVFATGFEGNIRTAVEKIVGPEIGNLLEDYPGVDKEGELRGSCKPQGHPGIWYATGDLGYTRYHSRFLALQIKAAIAGLPFEPYRKSP